MDRKFVSSDIQYPCKYAPEVKPSTKFTAKQLQPTILHQQYLYGKAGDHHAHLLWQMAWIIHVKNTLCTGCFKCWWTIGNEFIHTNQKTTCSPPSRMEDRRAHPDTAFEGSLFQLVAHFSTAARMDWVFSNQLPRWKTGLKWYPIPGGVYFVPPLRLGAAYWDAGARGWARRGAEDGLPAGSTAAILPCGRCNPSQ